MALHIGIPTLGLLDRETLRGCIPAKYPMRIQNTLEFKVMVPRLVSILILTDKSREILEGYSAAGLSLEQYSHWTAA